jgi:hypothetical protein
VPPLVQHRRDVLVQNGGVAAGTDLGPMLSFFQYFRRENS